MSNMRYCRFENTARDLRDCVEAIENGETEQLSSYELSGLEDLLSAAKDIVFLEDDIDDVLSIYDRNKNKK